LPFVSSSSFLITIYIYIDEQRAFFGVPDGSGSLFTFSLIVEVLHFLVCGYAHDHGFGVDFTAVAANTGPLGSFGGRRMTLQPTRGHGIQTLRPT
jgi:hypothetical protein